MKTRTFKIIFTFLFIIMLLNFIFIFFSFRNQPISNNLTDWSNFASYIGGSTGIITNLMSLLITLYIAYFLTDLKNNRNENNRIAENKKFIRQLKENEYSKISESLDRVLIALTYTDKEKASNEVFFIKMQFVSFFKTKKHLFPDLNPKDFTELDNCLIQLSEKAELVRTTDDKAIVTIIQSYQNEVGKFHHKIQESLIMM